VAFGVRGLKFGVWGLGLGVWGVGSEFRVSSFGIRVSGLGCEVLGLRVECLVYRVEGVGACLGDGLAAQLLDRLIIHHAPACSGSDSDSGFVRVQGSGFMV